MNRATLTLAIILARNIEDENRRKTAEANAKAIVDELEKRGLTLKGEKP